MTREIDDVDCLSSFQRHRYAALGLQSGESVLKACFHLGLGKSWLRIIAAEEEIVKTRYYCCKDHVDARQYGNVEVLGVVCSVVDQCNVVGNAGVVDKANVPRVALKLVKDRDLGVVQIETLQVVDHYMKGGVNMTSPSLGNEP